MNFENGYYCHSIRNIDGQPGGSQKRGDVGVDQAGRLVMNWGGLERWTFHA